MEVISRLLVFFAALLMVQATYSSLQAVSKVRRKEKMILLSYKAMADRQKGQRTGFM